MAIEDFTTWTLVGDGVLSLNGTNQCDYSGDLRTGEKLLYKDFGVGYFAGDFTIDFTLYMDSHGGVSNTWRFDSWGLANEIGTQADRANGALWVRILLSASGQFDKPVLRLYEKGGNATSGIILSLDTSYYIRVVRDVANSKLYCGIYSTENLRDVGDGTDGDVDNIEITTSVAGEAAFRYMYAISSLEVSGVTNDVGYVKDFEIQEEPSVTKPSGSIVPIMETLDMF